MLTRYAIMSITIISLFVTLPSVFSQKTAQIKSLLSDFKSFKYSNIYLYRIDSSKASTIFDINKFNDSDLVKNLASKKSKCEEISRKEIKPNKRGGKNSAPTLDVEKLLELAKNELRGDDNEGNGDTGEDEKDPKEADTKDEAAKEIAKLKANPLYKALKDSIDFDWNLIVDGYIITDRQSDSLSQILGFIGVKKIHYEQHKTDLNLEDIESCLNTNSKIVLLQNDLKNKKLDSVKSLYTYLKDRIIQQGAENVTAIAQGITGDIQFLPKKFGVTKAVDEDNIQQYLRITDGQPLDYKNEHELTVGIFDLIRYRHYGRLLTRNNSEDEVDLDNVIYNQYLPLFGAEIRYGLPEINYPSLWSERMTLNVMWQSNKLGIILPTNGWSNLSTSFFNQQRRLTNAGIGLYGSFDVPIKLINQGGVFNLNASYVFGDAKPNPINTSLTFFGRTANQLTDSNSYRNYEISYLPRFHAQAHYSFAINIDKYSFFRFKLGATAYMMQRFSELAKFAGKDSKTGKDIVETKNRLIDQYSYNDLSIYNKYDGLAIAGLSGLNATETIAGLSGRIEFMTNTEEQTVPWGGALQYFDGSLSGDMWIQVPIYGFSKIEEIVQTDLTISPDSSSLASSSSIQSIESKSTFAMSLRAQAQFYQTVFRDPRPWELQTVVIPSLQLLFNF